MNWKKLSSLAWFYLLTAALTLTVLSQAIPALALLSRGSQGPAVRSLQIQLRDAGFFSGPVTGVYGSITESAVRRFQANRGLVADGVAGNRTLAALSSRSASGTKAEVGPGTLELQQLLSSQGFYSGPLDGIYGTGTRSAVKLAQQNYGLMVDGIAGPITLSALRRRGKAKGQNTDGSSTLELQRLLAKQGFYDGPIDGVYGTATRRAVRAVQQAYGLAVDGVAGPTTLAALRRQGGGGSSQSSQTTVELQQLLAKRGFYNGSADGIYGPGTKSAVRAAQAQYGLVVDGVAGPATLAALRQGAPAQSTAQATDVLPVPAPPPRLRSGDAKTVSANGDVQTANLVSDVSYVQKLLAQRGFYQGTVDGVYGPQTRAAVIAAQRSYGLVPDGIAGPQTIKALERG